ncbi:MAG: COX15/CtaA family protein, partial [Variovorax sp.]
GPVTHDKAWIEMLHRYLATAVGASIIVLLVATVLERRRQQRQGLYQVQLDPSVAPRARSAALPETPTPPAPSATGRAAVAIDVPALHWAWPLATLVWVCLQGAFGALTVTHRLAPVIVTAHLLGAIVLLVLLCVQAVKYRQATQRLGPVVVAASLHALLVTTAALLLAQIALGGWVSSNYAVLACTQFPQCQGSWWPPMNFAQGFELWRGLGMTGEGAGIDFAALTAIHYAHRLLAYFVFLALGVAAWRLHKVQRLQAQARWLAGLALLQLATGLGNVLLGWPLAAALLHTGGAAALALALTSTLWQTRRIAMPIERLRMPQRAEVAP